MDLSTSSNAFDCCCDSRNTKAVELWRIRMKQSVHVCWYLIWKVFLHWLRICKAFSCALKNSRFLHNWSQDCIEGPIYQKILNLFQQTNSQMKADYYNFLFWEKILNFEIFIKKYFFFMSNFCEIFFFSANISVWF